MSVTVTPTIVDRAALVGGRHLAFADLTLSDTYATGGFILTAKDFQLMSLEDLVLMDGCDSTGIIWQYTRATKTVVLFWAPAGHSAVMDEVTNTTAVTGVMRVMAIGV